MYEFIQVGEKSGYINCPAKMGVYLASDSEVYLIDSGNDKDAGKKVRKLLEERNWKLKGIINTHSNADHIGGNRYLQQQTGCRVFSRGMEAAFIQNPVLEPSFLYGGFPCKDLRHKFLMAAESEVSDFSDPAFPRELEILDLPGHFLDMIGIRTPDGTVFLADCISSKSTLDKYQVSFIYDVAAWLETLDRVEKLEAPVFVPAHADAAEDIRELVQENRKKVHEIAENLLEYLDTPKYFDAILKQVFDRYQLSMNFEQHVLVGSTIRSYLSWLKDIGRVEAVFENNYLMWKKTN